MENLIQRWKTAQSSIKSDKRTSAPNSSKKAKYDFTSSSDEGSPEPTNKYAISMRSDLTNSGGKLQSSLNKNQKVSTPLKSSDGRGVNDAQVKTSDFDGSGKKSSRPIKKGIPMIIDENAYKIMDIFKYNADLSNQEKFQRIKKILEDVAESCTNKTEELEEQIQRLRQETNRVSMMTRADTSSKIISELESRLFESEKEKGQLRKEKEQLLEKVAAYEHEKQSTQIKISQELLDMVRKNQIILEDTNKELMVQLAEARKKDKEQQAIWQTEVNDMAQIIQNLKEQLSKKHAEEFE